MKPIIAKWPFNWRQDENTEIVVGWIKSWILKPFLGERRMSSRHFVFRRNIEIP